MEFEFIGGRLSDMHQSKTSLATLQLNLSHEAHGKQKVILGLMKILEQLKGDHEVLYGSQKANKLTADEKVSEKLRRRVDIITFTGKKFSNIHE